MKNKSGDLCGDQVYVGIDGIEWLERTAFEKLARESFKQASRESYQWRHALHRSWSQAERQEKTRRIESLLGLPIEKIRRMQEAEGARRRYAIKHPNSRDSKGASARRYRALEALRAESLTNRTATAL